MPVIADLSPTVYGPESLEKSAVLAEESDSD